MRVTTKRSYVHKHANNLTNQQFWRAHQRLKARVLNCAKAMVAGIIHPVSTTAPSNPLMSGSQPSVLAGPSAPATSNTGTASAGNSG